MIHARICPRRATCMHMRKCMVLSCTCIRVQGSCNHAVTQHRQSRGLPMNSPAWPSHAVITTTRRRHDEPHAPLLSPHLSSPRSPPDASSPSLLICFVKRFLSPPRSLAPFWALDRCSAAKFGTSLQALGEHEVRGEPCASSSAPRAGTRMGYRKPLKVARGARARTGGPRAVLREGVLTALEPGLGNRVSGRVLVADFLPPHPVGR
jgi:hypothetical protein